MKILILGGTGAIGSALIPILVEEGHCVTVTTRREKTSIDSLKYVKGNAKDLLFLSKLLKNEKYDVLIDFMLYDVEEFKQRINGILESVGQYIFLSSARVFANSKGIIDENSPRLLDISEDEEFLKKGEYSLTKAKQENILKESIYKNWVILRPYKTYNDNRLQLGVYEKEQWLYRVLRGKSVVIHSDMLDKYTSMTFASDTAQVLAKIIGNESLNSCSLNIASPETIKWSEVLQIYIEWFDKKGIQMKTVYSSNYKLENLIFDNEYRIKYDEMLNRKFSDSEIQKICNGFKWTNVDKGLCECLEAFWVDENRTILDIDYAVEGFFDRESGEQENVFQIVGIVNKLKYVIYRYLPRWIIVILKNSIL